MNKCAKWNIRVFSLLFSGLLLGGCALLDAPPEEKESTPDLTLAQLEKEMQSRRDPGDIFDKADTFVQKQIVTIRRFLGDQQYIIEARFKRPDKFSLLTILNNRPATGLILNGNSGWLINYQQQKVEALAGTELDRMKLLYRMSNPDSSYRDMFAQVKLTLCRIGDEEFYKLHCLSHLPGNEVDLYIGRNNFLLKRMRTRYMRGNTPVEYDSQVLRYSNFDGVLVPELTRVVQGGVEQETQVVENRLNVPLQDEEFLPPIF